MIFFHKEGEVLKLFLISIFLLSTLFATDAKEAAKNMGAENDFATAMNKAHNEKKMLVMVIVKENCRWCDKMVNRTMADSEVKEILKKNYVTLIIDRDDDFPSEFKENFFPSIFYIDYSSQKSIYENIGYVGKKCFLNDLNMSLKTRNELYK
jgi:thioredoxin-related protein